MKKIKDFTMNKNNSLPDGDGSWIRNDGSESVYRDTSCLYETNEHNEKVVKEAYGEAVFAFEQDQLGVVDHKLSASRTYFAKQGDAIRSKKHNPDEVKKKLQRHKGDVKEALHMLSLLCVEVKVRANFELPKKPKKSSSSGEDDFFQKSHLVDEGRSLLEKLEKELSCAPHTNGTRVRPRRRPATRIAARHPPMPPRESLAQTTPPEQQNSDVSSAVTSPDEADVENEAPGDVDVESVPLEAILSMLKKRRQKLEEDGRFDAMASQPDVKRLKSLPYIPKAVKLLEYGARLRKLLACNQQLDKDARAIKEEMTRQGEDLKLALRQKLEETIATFSAGVDSFVDDEP